MTMTDFETLLTQLSHIEKETDESWVQSLEPRKKQELEFHNAYQDRDRASGMEPRAFEKNYGNERYYSTAELSHQYVRNWIIEHVKGKIFLDGACGDGRYAILAAKAGAKLAVGIDLSWIAIENAKKDAKAAGVQDRTFFVQSDLENTRLPQGSVDVILCSGVLHHVDLNRAFPELERILAPEGKILGYEALGYNPVIQWYRRLTPSLRTEWEKDHILSLKNIRGARPLFALGEIRYWHIVSILGSYLRPLLPMLNAVDGFLTRVPGIQLMAWMFTFELLKSHPKKSSQPHI